MFRKIIVLESYSTYFCRRSTFTKANEESQISSKQLLLKLRNSTGYPLISCKQALKATDYDLVKAKDYLLNLAKEKGWNKMKNISMDKLCHGLIGVAKNKSTAAIVEVNCATDFVAKTKDFQHLVKDTADVVLHNFSTDTKISLSVDEVQDTLLPNKEQKLTEKFALTIGKVNEQIALRRACVLSAPLDGTIGSYVHPSSVIGASRPESALGTYVALASISCTSDERTPTYIRQRGRDLCQHIVGMRCLTVGEPQSLDNQKSIEETEQTEDIKTQEGPDQQFPPPDDQSTELLKQPFLLDSDISVEQWLYMSDMKVHDFIRFQVADVIDCDKPAS